MSDSKDAYAATGVDIEAGEEAVRKISDIVRSTYRPEVLGDIGGFGGMFDISEAKDMAQPVLVSSTDGVGTKLELAMEYDYHESVGIDLVAMCANDILVSGAEPLLFLDYIATGKNVPEKMKSIVKGIADGCKMAGCALVGGEMAEHNTMESAEYDLAGFCVGLVERELVVDGRFIEPGDLLIGLASSGLHSNGFSLVREVRDFHQVALHEVFPVQGEEFSSRIRHISGHGDSAEYRTVGEVLLQPTTIYVRPVLYLLRKSRIGHVGQINGLVHITGGGLGNISRVLPEGCGVNITQPLPVHPEFTWIRKLAEEHSDPKISSINANDMYRTFNMGMGMVIVVRPMSAPGVRKLLNKFDRSLHAQIIGRVTDDGLIRHAALSEPFVP